MYPITHPREHWVVPKGLLGKCILLFKDGWFFILFYSTIIQKKFTLTHIYKSFPLQQRFRYYIYIFKHWWVINIGWMFIALQSL